MVLRVSGWLVGPCWLGIWDFADLFYLNVAGGLVDWFTWVFAGFAV